MKRKIGEDCTLYHNGERVRIIYRPFDESAQGRIKGGVIYDKAGYLVVIDSTRSAQAQRYLTGHELAHIWHRHFDKRGVPVDVLECEAHRDAWHYYRLFRDGKLN